MILIFDLDDTLYAESDFVKSGFKAVANFISKTTRTSSEELYQKMLKLLSRHGRGKTFDMILSEHSLLTKKNIRKCLSIYRNHKPSIKLYPGAINILKYSISPKPYLVTDGNKLVQASKIKALDIEKLFSKIFITSHFGLKHAKPSTYCFEKIKNIEKCDWTDMVYVGDDPNKDFVNLNKLSVKTVRVHSGRYATTKAKVGYNAQYHIESISHFSTKILNQHEK